MVVYAGRFRLCIKGVPPLLVIFFMFDLTVTLKRDVGHCRSFFGPKSMHVGVLDHNLPYQRMIRKVTTSRYDMERIPVQLPHP